MHLKGHFCPTRHAAAYWREQTKAGKEVNAVDRPHDVDVGTVLEPGPGQLRRGQVGHRDVLAGLREGAACATACARTRSRPAARTRLTEATPGLGDVVKAPEDGFDVWDPANVSPFVAYLATADCPFTGETFFVQGGKVQRVQSWTSAEDISKADRWTIDELRSAATPSCHRSSPHQIGPSTHMRGQPIRVSPA